MEKERDLIAGHYLARSDSQSLREVRFICPPPRGASHMINVQ